MNSGYLLHVEHEEFAKRIEEEHQRINHRLKHLEDQEKLQTEVLLAIKEQTMEIKELKKAVLQQDERLETLENRDGESWRNFKWYIFLTIAGAVIGYIVNAIV